MDGATYINIINSMTPTNGISHWVNEAEEVEDEVEVCVSFVDAYVFPSDPVGLHSIYISSKEVPLLGPFSL